jgi:hypothetical protein
LLRMVDDWGGVQFMYVFPHHLDLYAWIMNHLTVKFINFLF